MDTTDTMDATDTNIASKVVSQEIPEQTLTPQFVSLRRRVMIKQIVCLHYREIRVVGLINTLTKTLKIVLC